MKQNVQYMEMASRDSGNDLKKWLRYLRKVVTADGSIFSPYEAFRIRTTRQIDSLHRAVFAQAIKNGTPTNKYVIYLNTPINLSTYLKELQAHEKTQTGKGFLGAE